MSGTGIREQVIQGIILLVQKYGIEKVILFGYRARGCGMPDTIKDRESMEKNVYIKRCGGRCTSKGYKMFRTFYCVTPTARFFSLDNSSCFSAHFFPGVTPAPG